MRDDSTIQQGDSTIQRDDSAKEIFMELFSIWQTTISLLTLTILEIVLGVDNLIFIAVATNRLPQHKQKAARQMGLLFAMLTRLLLLASAVWLVGLTKPVLIFLGRSFSASDFLLIGGGLFLLFKATESIHGEFSNKEKPAQKRKFARFFAVVIQIAILDIIFSLDSVMTAIGMTRNFKVMAAAIIIAILAMLFASEPLSRFINKNPSVKILAFSFLLMIGMALVADGFGFHIPRAYIYFAVSFSVFVEALNLLTRFHNKPEN